MDNLNQKFKKGIFWSFFGQFGYLIISFITNIIFARLLTPKEFGTLAIAMFFIALAKVLSESGLSGALIRKKEPTEDDYSTIFIFNLVVSLLLYIIIFFSAGYIADYYDDLSLKLYIRVLSSVILINAFQIIQNVRLIKELRYKQISYYSIVAVLIAAIISIGLAYFNFGIWALIVFQILNALILTLILYFREGFIKLFLFNRNSFKELYSFGMYTTISSFINSIYDNVYQLILGKYFSLNQTGYYFQAKKLSEIPVGIIKSATLGVVFSTLSNLQDQPKEFDKFYNNVVRFFTVFLGLICLLIFLFAKEIIYIIYGEKWLDSAFYMQILIISAFFYMHEMFNRILFKVFDKTDKILYLEIFSKVVGLFSILIGVYYNSIEVLMYGLVVTSIISYLSNYYISRKIYKTDNPFLEMNYTLKVLIVTVSIAIIYLISIQYFYYSLFVNLIYLPFIVISYLLILNILGVIKLKKDLKMLKNK